MIKKLISLVTIAACFAGFTFSISAAPSLNMEYDFENFTPDSVFTAPAEGYAIKADESSYLAIPTGTAKANAPVLNVNYGQNFTLEFDAKNSGAQQLILYAQFEGSSEYRLFTLLGDGRGPILRLPDDSPIFLYNTTDTKPSVSAWNTYKIEFDYAAKTMKVYVNDEPIEKYYDRSYSPMAAAFPGTKLVSLRFYLDSTRTSGDACYDNVMLYSDSVSGGEEFTDDFYKEAYLKLDTLKAITDTISGYPMEQNLTRAEFTELIMQTLGMNITSASQQLYQDVPVTHSKASAVNMANMMGFIAKSENFRPDEYIKLSEAVTIICNINGYSRMAEINGGWPGGFMNMAYEYELLKNITVKDRRQLVNMKDAVIMIENALTAPMMKITLTGVGEASYEEDEDETILYKYHGLKEIEGNIDTYNTVSKSVTFTEKKTGIAYTAYYSADNADIEDTVQNIWIDEEYENITYMYPVKDSAVVYGYITEVNSSENEKEYNVSDIKRIAATSCVRTSLSDGAVITLNDAEVTDKISPIGMYSRLVISKGSIVKLELFDVSEGGIIESASSEKIIYSSGAFGYSVIEDISENKPVKIILNNEISNIKALKKDVYFDYLWIDGGLMIIASNNKAEGILRTTGSDTIEIETEDGSVIYEKDPLKLYISAEGSETFGTEYTASSYLNKNVVVFADAAGVARYMKAGESDSFYGVIIRYDDGEIETELPNLTIAKLGTDGVSEHRYEVDIKSDVLYYPEVGYYDVALNGKKTDGSGVYKFYEKNGVIRKIEEIEWYNGGSVTLGDKFDYRAVRVYFDGSWKGINKDRIFLLKNARGEFEITKIEWSELVNKWASGAKALVAKTEPISPITIITEYETSIYQDAIQFGFIESVSEYYGEDEEMHTKYAIAKQGSVSNIDLFSDDSLKYSGRQLGKFDFIVYAPGSLNKYTSGMIIKGAVNMGEEWTESTVSSIKLTHMGVYAGITSGYLKTSLGGENKYMLMDTAGCPVYEVNKNHTKFNKVSNSDMIGKDLWVISVGDIARGIFFEK